MPPKVVERTLERPVVIFGGEKVDMIANDYVATDGPFWRLFPSLDE
ncbi:MAG: hypothetical protein WAK31_19245 [Chthoniobacterales bacterium]